MTIQVDAIFAGGVLHPKVPVSLPEGAEVRIAIESSAAVVGNGTISTARPVWEELADAARSLPTEEIDKLPSDGAARHDLYIYGVEVLPK